MAATITVREAALSRNSIADRSGNRNYIITGDEYFPENDAIVALQAAAPVNLVVGVSTLVRQPVQLDPIGDPTFTYAYSGTVNYSLNKEDGPEDPIETESFNTTGGNAKIKQSLATVDTAGNKSDYDNAINVSNDGGNLTVDGVDITSPVYSFSVNKYFDAAVITNTYKGTLFALTGQVNNATFKGLLAGECLFLGAVGNEQSNGDWMITFNFAGSPNKTGLEVNPSASVPLTVDKKGWEYLWVEYKEEKDTTSKKLKKVVAAAYVEKVYELGNFTVLGLT